MTSLRSTERALDLAYRAEQTQRDEHRGLVTRLWGVIAAQAALLLGVAARAGSQTLEDAYLLKGLGTWTGLGLFLIVLYFLSPRCEQRSRALLAAHVTERSNPQRALRLLDKRYRELATENDRLRGILTTATFLFAASAFSVAAIAAATVPA